MSIDRALEDLPQGWRFSVGHIHHWYGRDELPKNLRRKGFEAFVLNGEPIGTAGYVFESADAATPGDALKAALRAAIAKARIHVAMNADAD
jgi:hypothetical protein